MAVSPDPSSLATSGATVSLPNIITLCRIGLVPVIFWAFVSGRPVLAFAAFVVAGISDAVDGFLAKTFDMKTELGAYLDPIADKLLIVSIYVALGVVKELPLLLVVLVVSRDILIVLGVLLAWLLDRPVRIAPSEVSRWNTAAQLLLVATVLADEAFKLQLEAPWIGGASLGYCSVRDILVWSTGMLTILSLGDYARIWLRHMSGEAGAAG
ncbi:MAG TPA: CDP-alcohol phosphatidyltransferase family protein [Hyphomicrobiaceae bacterium]|nr:CDP-alcohol phosphatidyltransferase family protein [Hyphomicrobiaceae bacterium]